MVLFKESEHSRCFLTDNSDDATMYFSGLSHGILAGHLFIFYERFSVSVKCVLSMAKNNLASKCKLPKEGIGRPVVMYRVSKKKK